MADPRNGGPLPLDMVRCYANKIQQRQYAVVDQVTWSVVALTQYDKTAKINNQYAKIYL